MEQTSLWVTIATLLIFPFIGWVFNTLITRNMNEIRDQQKVDRELFLRRLDEEQDNVKENYVRVDLYKLATELHNSNNDEKFKSLLAIMTTQFDNMDGKIGDTNDKIDDLKKFINDKFNGNGNNH